MARRLACSLALLSSACTYAVQDVPSPCEANNGRPGLRASPKVHSQYWSGDLQAVPTFASMITHTGCGSLADLTIVSQPDWLEVRLGEPADFEARVLELVADSSRIVNSGIYDGVVELEALSLGGDPVAVEVQLQFGVPPPATIHVGTDQFGCPRDLADGFQSLCDHWGPEALTELEGIESANILVYDDYGYPAYYNGGITFGRNTSVSAAPGVDFNNVVVWRSGFSPVITLVGSDIHLANLTILVGERGGGAIYADQAERVLIENIRAVAPIADMLFSYQDDGVNGVRAPFTIGRDSIVRNCAFLGHFEQGIDLFDRDNVQIVHNTFMFFQQPVDHIFAQRSRRVVIGANVFVSMSVNSTHAIEVDDDTRELLVAENVFAGYDDLVLPLTGAADFVEDNNTVYPVSGDGAVPLESPLRPFFLLGQTPLVGNIVAPQGTSLDRLPLGTAVYPGAFQGHSALSARRTVFRIGPEPQSCGNPCDLLQDAENELQVAVWSVWPGGQVQLYPSPDPYHGRVALSWDVTIIGQGPLPDSVVVEGLYEGFPGELIRATDQSRADIFVPADTRAPVHLKNFTLLAGSDAAHAIVFETAGESLLTGTRSPLSTQWIERLRVQAFDQHDAAMVLGDNVVVRDTVILGEFSRCIEMGGDFRPDIPQTTSYLYNITCRLGGLDDVTAFAIAGFREGLIANVALEIGNGGGTILRVQDASTGLPGPQPVDAHVTRVTYTAAGTELFANLPAPGTSFLDFSAAQDLRGVSLLFAEAFYDCELSADCNSINGIADSGNDDGVDPFTIYPQLLLGTSYEGRGRAFPYIDRGAFED